jgi:hypothetical protein
MRTLQPTHRRHPLLRNALRGPKRRARPCRMVSHGSKMSRHSTLPFTLNMWRASHSCSIQRPISQIQCLPSDSIFCATSRDGFGIAGYPPPKLAKLATQEGTPQERERIVDTDLPTPDDFSESGVPLKKMNYEVAPRSIVVLRGPRRNSST